MLGGAFELQSLPNRAELRLKSTDTVIGYTLSLVRDDAGQPYAFVTIYLNDEDIRFHGGFAAAVADGDEIPVVPAIAGG